MGRGHHHVKSTWGFFAQDQAMQPHIEALGAVAGDKGKWVPCMLTAKHIANNSIRASEAEEAKAASNKRATYKAKAANPHKGLSLASRAVRPRKAQGIACGQDSEGSTISAPEQVGAAVVGGWKRVHDGNAVPVDAATKLCEQYDRLMIELDEFPIECIAPRGPCQGLPREC